MAWRTLFIGLTLAWTLPSLPAFAEGLGLCETKPAEGRYAEANGRFLVAYEQTIPGSGVAFKMAPAPGGSFRLGSPDNEPGRNANEGPLAEIQIKPFWVGVHEVTWGEYRQFMRLANAFEAFEDRGLRPVTDENRVDAVTAPSKLYDPSFAYGSGEDPRLPAVTMSQYAAKQYTKWLSLLTGQFYRLPTEAEWEYACRAGAATAYSFGEEPSELALHAWFADNSGETTHLVGQKLPNAWGLYDMHGNAAEWVLDELRPNWYLGLAKGAPAAEALCWPSRLSPRVLRGGSFLLGAADCRSATRRGSDDTAYRAYDPNTPKSPWWFASEDSLDVGFRIVRPLDPPPREQWNKYWDADLPRVQQVADYRIDEEGRGERGVVDPGLPAAIENLKKSR